MPYIITEGRRPNTYMVINDITGKVHSFGSTLENAKKQLKVLQHLEGLEHIEGSGLLYNEKTNKVSIPSTNDIQFIIPPFLVRERGGKNKYRLKLVNPLTKQRNISSREKDLNIQIFRKLTPTADLQFSMTDYDLNEFSPKDRATIREYDALISNVWGDNPKKNTPILDGYNIVDYKEVPDVKFYNQPRGFPTELPANDGKPKRKGYKDIMAYLEGQDVDFNQMRTPPKRRRRTLSKKKNEDDDDDEEEEPMEEDKPVEKKPRGRPRTRPIVSPEDKKPRGRPRTRPIVDENVEKKPRGRPRKSLLEKEIEEPIDITSLRKMTDKKLQKELNSRKTVLDWTIKKLNENDDPTKVQDIEKDIDMFRVRYLNALNEMDAREHQVANPKTPKVATPNPTDMQRIKAYPKKDVEKVRKLLKQLNKLKGDDPKSDKLYEKLDEIENYDEIMSYLDEDEEPPILEEGRKKGKTGGKISSNNIMPNRWIEYVKDYASKNGIRYGDALKDPQCKAGYKRGGMVDEGSDSESDSDDGIHIDIGSHNKKRGGGSHNQGGTLFKIEPGRITHQAGTRGVVVGNKKGFGLIDEGSDYGVIAKSKNNSGLGANAGRKFISL